MAKASFWENFQRDLGSWEDVVGEIVLTERQAKIYQERLGKFTVFYLVFPLITVGYVFFNKRASKI